MYLIISFRYELVEVIDECISFFCLCFKDFVRPNIIVLIVLAAVAAVMFTE